MFALSECEQDREIGVSIFEIIDGHLFLPLPFGPVSNYIYFLGVFVGLGLPIEVDGLSGAASCMVVTTLSTLILLYHSNIIEIINNHIYILSILNLSTIPIEIYRIEKQKTH